MKRDHQMIVDRRNRILAMLRQQKEMTVSELAETFDVSLMTIRRDLQYLEDTGLVTRFYGGATAIPDRMFDDRDLIASCRSVIAREAAAYVNDGECIFINGSMTALGMLPYLYQKDLRIITNNGFAVTMAAPSNAEIIISGGTVQGDSGILTGDDALRNLLTLHAEKAFIGCTGISPGGELLCGIPTELAINETMIDHCESFYILADHTKIGVTGNYASWHLEKTGTIITDALAPSDVVEQLKNIGMTVIKAK